MHDLTLDLRYALRSLAKNPGFTAVVVLTLALGIGANTAIFTVVDAVLLKPLPYPNADALVSVGHTTMRSGEELPSAPYLYFTYRDQNRTLAGVGLWRTAASNVTGQGAPEQVQGLAVTSDVLSILGVAPLLGRTFSLQDDEPGGRPTVILTYGYWQRRFGGDASVLGRTLLVDGQALEMIGVMPPSFRFLDRPVDIVYPFQLDRGEVTLGRYVFHSLARLRPGIRLAEARADMERLVPLAIEAFPPPPGYTRQQFQSTRLQPRLRPLHEEVVGDLGRTLWLLTGALGVVLLIACANVANLLLARVEGRQQELAVRAALGAGAGRIARELLTESVLLGLLGGAAGLAVAQGGLQALVALRPAHLPRLDEIAIDARVLLFALAVSLLAGLSFGLLPLVRFVRPRLAATLRSGGRSLSQSRERHRAQSALVIAQVAMALVLLVCSGLMVRTLQALGRVDSGFSHPEQVQMVHVAIAAGDVPEPERVTRMQQAILARLAAIPGVASAAFVDIPPMTEGNDSDTVLLTEGQDARAGRPRPLRRFEFASPGLFRTLGIPMRAGRDLTWEDLYERRNVALVSENLARADWGSVDEALGKRVRVSPSDPWREIVGVVGDVHDDGVIRRPPPIVYFPSLMDRFWGQPTMVFRSATFVIRGGRAGTESFLREVEQAVWSVDPNLPLAQVRTLDEVYRRSLGRMTFTLVLLGIAGAMGLLLGLVGIYGVVAHAVAQRRLEIGIRVALGARAGALQGMFVREAARLAGAGVAAGLLAAAALSRLMSSLLFGVGPLDPVTYAIVTLLLIAVAMAAAYVPARRSTRVDPIEVLRNA
jgi:putative ABC transport system permease protein